jgi:hypothetical protein
LFLAEPFGKKKLHREADAESIDGGKKLGEIDVVEVRA